MKDPMDIRLSCSANTWKPTCWMSHLNGEVWLSTKVSSLALTLVNDLDWSLTRWWWTPNPLPPFNYEVEEKGQKEMSQDDPWPWWVQIFRMLIIQLLFWSSSVRGWTWGVKICRLKTEQWDQRDQLAAFLEVTMAIPWLGQPPPAQEIYPFPTDDGDTIPCTLGKGRW